LIIGAVVMAVPTIAHADPLGAFDRKFEQLDQFFQPMDEPAPTFKLFDPDGHTVSLTDLHGKVVVLNFIYTRCPDVCPLESDRIALIQRTINPTDLRDQVRFISITGDPANDTPGVMKAYREQHGLDPVNWTFLTSGADHPNETPALSLRYDNHFQREADGSFTHGAVFHVIDQQGIWRGNFHGLDWKPEHLVMFVTELARRSPGAVQGTAPSLWERITHLL
jgi:protein SCO1/2